MLTQNPSLVMTIWGAATSDAETLKSAVLHAAVHAWYEGHIEAHTVNGQPAIGDASKLTSSLPSPPFPPPDSEELGEILAEVEDRYDDDVVMGAIAHAAGMAWAAGFRTGEKCRGCSWRGTDPELAAEMRSGRMTLMLVEDEPEQPKKPRRRQRSKR